MKTAIQDIATPDLLAPLSTKTARAMVAGWDRNEDTALGAFALHGDLDLDGALEQLHTIEAVDAVVQPQHWRELVAVRDFLLSRRSWGSRFVYRLGV